MLMVMIIKSKRNSIGYDYTYYTHMNMNVYDAYIVPVGVID